MRLPGEGPFRRPRSRERGLGGAARVGPPAATGTPPLELVLEPPRGRAARATPGSEAGVPGASVPPGLPGVVAAPQQQP